MKRKLLFANLVLLAVTAAVVMHLRSEWMEADAREQAFLRQRIRPAPAPPFPPLRPVPEVKAAGYAEIAQKMLFSKDRNPIVVVEPPPPPPPKPMPALPLFHGIVDLGNGAMAIMSENAKAPHRDYQPGDKVGAFKLVSVSNDAIVLEWEGHTVSKTPDEMMDHSIPAPGTPGAPAAASNAQAAAAQPAKIAPPDKPGPGIDLGRGVRGCQPGDTSPEGAVIDGMRKVIKPSPFGNKCYWESLSGQGQN